MDLRTFETIEAVDTLVASADFAEITEALHKVSEDFFNWTYGYMETVQGGDSSIRLFSEGAREGAISLPRPMYSQALAQTLLDFSATEARYPEPEEEGKTKGWEISLAWIESMPVAVARAVWV